MEDFSRKYVTFEDIERRAIGAHIKPYYDWLRHVVTLALAALTTLVALQGHYVPSNPKFPVLLAIGWASLALTIALGLWALRSEYTTPLRSIQRMRRLRKEHGDAHAANVISQNSGTLPEASHKWAVRGMVVSFLIALVVICAFAIANLPW